MINTRPMVARQIFCFSRVFYGCLAIRKTVAGMTWERLPKCWTFFRTNTAQYLCQLYYHYTADLRLTWYLRFFQQSDFDCPLSSNHKIKIQLVRWHPPEYSMDPDTAYHLELICLFGVYCLSREFFTHMEMSPLPVKVSKFWLMAIDHLGFFIVAYLLWHGAFVYNGHLRGPLTLTPIAERLAVELSLPVYDLGLSRLRFEHSTFRLRGQRCNLLRHRRGIP